MIRSMVKESRKKPFAEHTSNKKERLFLMSQLECRIHTIALLNAATTGFRGGACAWSLKILCLAVLQPGVPSNHPPAPKLLLISLCASGSEEENLLLSCTTLETLFQWKYEQKMIRTGDKHHKHTPSDNCLPSILKMWEKSDSHRWYRVKHLICGQTWSLLD